MINLPKTKLWFVIAVLLLVNFYLWRLVLAAGVDFPEPAVYFLDVGQGDSQLVLLDGVKILIDGGKDGRVIGELEKILGAADKYLDLIILSHSELDHYGGLLEAANRYQVGMFIHNGKGNPNVSFGDLKKSLKTGGIPDLILSAGDRITYRDYRFLILSPDKKWAATNNNNEASLVVLLQAGLRPAEAGYGTAKAGGKKVLFTGDIGHVTEKRLAEKYRPRADILKVPHHGSRNSSSREFITQISPKISVIGVGKNSYGHPSGEVLKLLAAVGSTVYRTDTDGTVKIPLASGGQPPPAKPLPPPSSYKISISQVSSGSANDAANEFIRLSNTGAAPVTLDNWMLKKLTKSGKEYSLVARNKFKGVIPAGGHFLIAHRNYRGAAPPDLFYSNKSSSLAAKNNTVILYDSFGNLAAKYSY